MSHCYPVLLAGGLGARLWPLSREIYPKQLLTVSGNNSLLQQTALRALELSPPENIITVTTHPHYRGIRDQLQELEPHLGKNLLVEPEGRNTAAAIGVATLHAQNLNPNSTLVIMPADHSILRPQQLHKSFQRALELADTGRIVTLGIQPTRPETGFGYITIGNQIPHADNCFETQSFVEKPDSKTVLKLIATKTAFWNSGIFVVTPKTLLNEMNKYAGIAMEHITNASKNSVHQDGVITFQREDYLNIPSIPIDKLLMERSQKLALIPIDVGWSDVGSWQRIWEISEKDEDGLAVIGDALGENCRNTLLRSEHRLVVGAGLDNLAVVETADAVLVTALGNDSDLRKAFHQLKGLERPEATRHLKENRPWGSFQVLMESPGFKIKELVIEPGGRLSLQSHKHRTEHWVVVEGKAKITRGDKVEFIDTNQSTYIAADEIHRLENCTKNILRVVEVQCGDFLSEDDIERYDDIYGR
ncbi:MAG: mannose-1-phosphate guanylyltransferase/mannose-6-phosphate isomerase [Pseudomonadota bacterium]|nr:mannose-1-phosphate guanylyltransferase/mannose-6-phosphate isomerase [Pseudomonadota bacterium]